MEYLIIAAQLITSLALLVVLHEFGHYIPAKLFKTRIEKFYLFFDPGFALFKKKIGETEWGIGWLPLGGYVKIAGMVDESMDKEQMSKPAQPWEFRSKPAWQRLIIMLGGVTVNFVLGLFIYAMILFTWGRSYSTPETAEKFGMHVADPQLKQYGLEDGDIPVKVGDRQVDNLAKIFAYIVIDGERTITVKRDGQLVDIELPANFDQIVLKNEFNQLYNLRIPVVVNQTSPNSGAEMAGLKEGDSIVTINGESTLYFDQFQAAIKSNKSQTVAIGLIREGQEMTLDAKVDSMGIVGVAPFSPARYNLKYENEEFGFFEAFPAGISYGIDVVKNYAKSLGLVFTKEGAKSVGGFGSMSKIFAPQWDWFTFWNATALLSLILAFMNILPIPALDGGHVVFLLYEIVSGRQPSQKVLEVAQYIGFFLLIGLMLYANGNDLFKFLNK